MKVLAFFAALSLCAALALTALYTVAISPDTYARHQDKLAVAEWSGFTKDELRALNEAVAHYLRGSGELTEPDFSVREQLHMQDVRALVLLCARVMAVCWVHAALGVGILVFRLGWRAPKVLMRGALWALCATALVAGFVVIGAVFNFGDVFIKFHELLFTNDMWLLSPSSTLIRMFPEDFFRAIAADIGVRFAAMLLACAVLLKGVGRCAHTRG